MDEYFIHFQIQQFCYFIKNHFNFCGPRPYTQLNIISAIYVLPLHYLFDFFTCVKINKNTLFSNFCSSILDGCHNDEFVINISVLLMKYIGGDAID